MKVVIFATMTMLTGCALFRTPLFLDPILAICTAELSNAVEVRHFAQSLAITPEQLAKALCTMPAVFLPYATHSSTATDDAVAAVKDMRMTSAPARFSAQHEIR
jgi:hypothetical protein